MSRPGASSGQDASEVARAADRAARAHYDAHDYTAAITEYRQAYSALPDALFLFDIAQAYRQLHDCDHAVEFYRSYLHARPDADNRGKVEQFISEMAGCATEPTDAAPVAPAPTTTTVTSTAQPLPPPTATVVTGTSASHGVSTSTLQITGAASAGVGAVVIAIAAYYSVQASNYASQLGAMCARGCSGASVALIDQAGQSANNDAIAGYVIGGVAFAAGAGLFLWASNHRSSQPIIVAPAPGGATVSARVRF